MAQDIYRTGERNREIGNAPARPLSPPRPLPSPRSPIWYTVVFLALIVFIIALGSILIVQRRLLNEQRRAVESRGPSAAAPAAPLTIAPTPVPAASFDPIAQMTMDDFTSVVPESPAEGERPPLTTYWLLQAAYQLRQADTAYRRGSWAAAITAYRQALRIVPDIEDAEARIGLCYLRLRDYRNAEASLAAAVSKPSALIATHNNLGVALLGQEKHAEAETAFRAALQRDSNYLPALRNLALLKYRTGDMAAAAELFGEALSRAADDPDGVHMRAVALMRTQRWKEAVSLLQESAQKWPEVPPIRFRLAQALANAGDTAAAMESLRKGVDLIDSARALAWLTRPDFDVLRGEPEFQRLIEQVSRTAP